MVVLAPKGSVCTANMKNKHWKPHQGWPFGAYYFHNGSMHVQYEVITVIEIMNIIITTTVNQEECSVCVYMVPPPMYLPFSCVP